MTESFQFSSPELARLAFGPNDANLGKIETLLEREVTLKGTVASISPPSDSFISFFTFLEKFASERGPLGPADVDLAFLMTKKESMEEEMISVSGKTFYPKSLAQKKYMECMRRDNIVIATGPAGTGKTYLAVVHALSELLSGKKERIVLTRPVMEAGESLGYLPGDLKEKSEPYMRPLYDAMEDVISRERIERMEESGEIEVLPLAYMRGRTLKNSIAILDEAQNATKAQMLMFLTRLSDTSKAIVAGDEGQSDLPTSVTSGLSDAAKRLSGIKGISVVRFTSSEAVRSRMVSDIVRAYSASRVKEGEVEGQ